MITKNQFEHDVCDQCGMAPVVNGCDDECKEARHVFASNTSANGAGEASGDTTGVPPMVTVSAKEYQKGIRALSALGFLEEFFRAFSYEEKRREKNG